METGTLKELKLPKGSVVEWNRKEYVCQAEPRPYMAGDFWAGTERGGWLHGSVTVRIISRATPQTDLTGPVRTVTRKELVNGKFGIVHLIGHDTGYAQIKLEAGDQLKSWFAAAEIRAAIATLTQIADALEAR